MESAAAVYPDAQPPGAFEEEGSASRHFAMNKPTGSMPPPLQQMPAPLPHPLPLDTGKSVGTRFYEECHDGDLPSPRLRSTRMLKGKGKDVASVEREERKKPLTLLDLPVDILKDIVKEVTHTNDMTSLALCHSALHRLTISHIYSRFDIVWPDTTTHTEQRSGVDALTYGLATLVMAEEIFGEAPGQRKQQSGRNRFNGGQKGKATDVTVRRRRGNHYAQFTRKFSLGNGPADWVQEYLISKEGGKMLGTLVALAVARMRSLETFVWDMPTGILRDVWLALSSLGDREDERECRLEKVWVRWHDNSSGETTNPIPPPPPPNYQMHAFPPASTSADAPAQAPLYPAALDRVEHPSFSVLPPLKSLSVLDIDEIAYLDEMAVLIGRSLDKLRELRVGIARHAVARDFVTCWDGESLEQVDHEDPAASSVTIGERRLGGVLGILTGLVSDMRKPKRSLLHRRRRRSRAASAPQSPPPAAQPPPMVDSEPPIEASGALPSLTSLRDMLPDISTAQPSIETGPSALSPSLLRPDAADSDPLVEMCSHASSPMRTPSLHPSDGPASPELVTSRFSGLPSDPVHPLDEDPPDLKQEYLDNTLKLENLELERIQLCIPVLQRAIDWTTLTSLTLLHCINHEQLWKSLRRTFAPIPKSPIYPSARQTPSSTPRKGGKASTAGIPDVEMSYRLPLKKIHTNTVSPALIAFLKETLAPNSLETLFLQETRSYSSPVTVDHIYKGPLRRHRASLKRVLIDSSEKAIDGGVVSGSGRWRRWMVGREILGFVMGGKMGALRELGVVVDYRDWHFFLQSLPSIPHLRSLSIPFLADHVHGSSLDPRELALQIVDIVALRPEVELCYMGIAGKCFEILENRKGGPDFLGAAVDPHGHGDGEGSDGSDEDVVGGEGDGDDAEEDVVEDEEGEETASTSGSSDGEDDVSVSSEWSDDSGGGGRLRLRLREILFYDDKVAVFKARHGRL